MANITEVSEFTAAVPELATNTQAIGGPGGAMNSQAQALANRTKYLKDVLDAQGVLTEAGRIDANAIAATAGASLAARLQTAANVEDGADVTDATNVQAALTADASGGRSALGLGDSATLDVGTGAGDVAAGNAPAGAVTTHESTYAHANIPTADEKTRLGDIQAATGATTALKLANLTSPATPTQQGVALLGASGGATKLTKMPDGATAVYFQDVWATTDSWSGVNGTLDVTSGFMRLVAGSSGSDYFGFQRTISGIGGKVAVFRYRSNIAGLAFRKEGTSSTIIVLPDSNNNWVTISVLLPLDTTIPGFYKYGFSSGNYIHLDWVWIGDYSYLTGSLSEEAARIANLRGDMPGVGVYASQTITASTTTLPTAGKGDTIGGKKYTFVAALTASPGVEGEVLIDASGGDDATKCKNTLENLNLALSEEARTNNGTLYWAAAVHPLVSSARVNEVLTLTAKTKNGSENNITVVCEAGTNHTAGGATLLGGYTDSAAKTIAEVQNNIAGNGTRPAAARAEKTNTSLIGYELTLKVANGATFTLPAGGNFDWIVYEYDANIGGADSGRTAGGTTLTMAGANSKVWYRRYS